MKNTIPATLIIIFVIAVAVACWAFHYLDAELAKFIMSVLVSVGTLTAVFVAIYGEAIRDWVNPIRLAVEIPEERNNMLDSLSHGRKHGLVFKIRGENIHDHEFCVELFSETRDDGKCVPANVKVVKNPKWITR